MENSLRNGGARLHEEGGWIVSTVNNGCRKVAGQSCLNLDRVHCEERSQEGEMESEIRRIKGIAGRK